MGVTLEDPALFFIVIGCLLLAGVACDALGHKTHVPRVTLLLLVGMAVGKAGFDALPNESERLFPLFADISLLMIGFLLGGRFHLSALRRMGRQVLSLSLGKVAAVALCVGAGMHLLGAPAEAALALAGIAAATAPAATVDVVHQTRAKGPMTSLLLMAVAIDDVWALTLFTLLAAWAGMIRGAYDGAIWQGLWEVFGAGLLGLALGLPTAQLTGRLKPGEPMMIEALGAVLVCGGLALWLNVSFFLSAIVLGATVANLAKHHDYPFHAIENIEAPFLLLFFLLAGATVEMEQLRHTSWLALGYVVFRTVGLMLGAWCGGALGRLAPKQRLLMGMSLLPQAGVALGMALVAAKRFPELASLILPLVIGSTVFFEVTGPFFTRLALKRAGEIGDDG